MENNYSIRSLTEEIGKAPANFTKADIIQFICDNNIRHINFQYPAGDGRLKTLNFVINDIDYLEEILSCGERVDGSISSWAAALSPSSFRPAAVC